MHAHRPLDLVEAKEAVKAADQLTARMHGQRENDLVAVEWPPGDLGRERSVPAAEACGLRFHRGGHAIGTLPLDRLPGHDPRLDTASSVTVADA